MNHRDVLAAAIRSGALVQIGRHRLEEPTVFSTGFVVGASDALVCLHSVSDRIDLDGFEVVRVRDITSASADFPRKVFYERALALKGIVPEPGPAVDLSDLARAVATISERYPLLAFARERTAADELSIGQVVQVLRTGFRVRHIDLSAVLEEDAEFEPFAGITRLQFGGEYETTLALVAGLDAPTVGGAD